MNEAPANATSFDGAPRQVPVAASVLIHVYRRAIKIAIEGPPQTLRFHGGTFQVREVR